MAKIDRDRPIFVRVERMQQLFDYSRDTLQLWEEKGHLKEGIHFIRVNGGQRRYNVALIEDLLINWSDFTAHQRAIANYLNSLPSNQKSRKVS